MLLFTSDSVVKVAHVTGVNWVSSPLGATMETNPNIKEKVQGVADAVSRGTITLPTGLTLLSFQT